MIKQTLAVGNKIEMTEISKKNSEEKKILVSQILEFDEEDEEILRIAMPMYERKLIPVQEGRRYHLCFYTNRGMYLADCVIEGRYREDNIYFLMVRLTTPLKKNQRRQYYRMNWYYRLRFKVFDAEALEEYEREKKIPESLEAIPFMDGTALDLSGGGVRFVTMEKLNKEDMLLLRIEFETENGLRSFDVPSQVIAAGSTRRDENLYEVRMCFTDIAERNREAIIKYIFNEERKKRQGGAEKFEEKNIGDR